MRRCGGSGSVSLGAWLTLCQTIHSGADIWKLVINVNNRQFVFITMSGYAKGSRPLWRSIRAPSGGDRHAVEGWR